MLDSNSLTSSEMNELQAMLEDSGFFELSSSSPNPTKGADYFVYEITVETDGRIHRVKTTDSYYAFYLGSANHIFETKKIRTIS